MWSFAKNPNSRFRNRGARLMATTWHRAGASGAVSAATPPPLPRSWVNPYGTGNHSLALTTTPILQTNQPKHA